MPVEKREGQRWFADDDGGERDDHEVADQLEADDLVPEFVRHARGWLRERDHERERAERAEAKLERLRALARGYAKLEKLSRALGVSVDNLPPPLGPGAR